MRWDMSIDSYRETEGSKNDEICASAELLAKFVHNALNLRIN